MIKQLPANWDQGQINWISFLNWKLERHNTKLSCLPVLFHYYSVEELYSTTEHSTIILTHHSAWCLVPTMSFIVLHSLHHRAQFNFINSIIWNLHKIKLKIAPFWTIRWSVFSWFRLWFKNCSKILVHIVHFFINL